ncbi:putative secreted protein (Por secretion system target) [Flavobacteriaceae bacterium MAR_2010_72]|nr:putative secreted protein (Por secretion system target) [Flavobacteriaceae bacterium MAR_2010_72]
MNKQLLLILFLFSSSVFAQQQTATYNVSPSVFEETDNITLTFNGSSINESTWGVTGNALYLWSWSYDLNLSNLQDCPTNGTWVNSNEANRLTYNAGSDTYTISFVPTTFYGRTGIGRIGFLIKAKDGTGDKKSQDILVDVGAFQVSLTSPAQNSATIITSGGNLSISATNTGGNANYVLKANGSILNSQSNVSSYSYSHNAITSNQFYELEVTQATTTITKKFSVLIDPGTISSTLSGTYVDGINYDPSDPTKATLLLYANGKDFVYVAGSFNNWQPTSAYAMNRDFSRNGRYWLTLTGLTPGQVETFQYWVVDKTPVANSQKLVKVADPYSTLILNSFDDPEIASSGSYPGLPNYPTGGGNFEVTVLQTNQTPFNWQVTNFTKPKKEDLIVYEVLIRDFDADRNFQDLIDRIDYFKNLNINAIELMPVMEFEGNKSWGYNTAHHMALDKFYGTKDKFKELIDLYHQNGIAVILDIALNHAFGRSSLVRMWSNDPDGDGYGPPSTDNPYFNTSAKHSYSVGEDFNHQSARTKEYVKRVIKHWIEEFKIDGFRWDLTKGFTQNCTAGDDGCTNSYQADRVAVLKEYADYSWSLDPDHYVIFEHLGGDTEEQEWANYRLGEGKGIMMWSEMWNDYKNLALGNASNFDRMGHTAHGFTGKRALGYPESHDKDRVMYEMVQFGNGGSGWDLNTSLMRMSALGAVTIPIPGPKMIWHFADLGMDDSIWTCNNGVVNSDYDGNNDGDCKLDTKPQPQWVENWLGDANRSQVRSDWARLIDLKINEPVFEGNYSINSGSLTPRIYIWNDALPNLKNVVILANFGSSAQNVTPDFPYTGTWYDLMDATGSTTLNVTSTSTPINIPAGGFKVYGNMASTLSTDSFTLNSFRIYPNPASKSFKVNKEVDAVSVYDITGKSISKFTGGFAEGHEFDVSKLAQGFYIIKLEQGTSAITKQLIIN